MKLEQNVKQTLKKIKLNKKDKILVALSGGKDSSVVAYLLKKFGYNIEGFHIHLGMGKYSDDCFLAVKKLCEKLGIRLHVYDIKKEMGSGMCYLRTAIQTSQKGKGLKNCAICGVIKKWVMNREARKLKVKKIATGHNLDDECQTFLMNVLKGSPQLSANSGAITQNVEDKKFVTRIKPLFYVDENEIRKYAKEKKLPVVFEKCPCLLDSYRKEVRQFTNNLTTREKENVLRNMEKLSKRMKKIATSSLNYCEECGEPSREKVCRMCGMLGK